jgi:GNAT superfamily N-acetyltransferase
MTHTNGIHVRKASSGDAELLLQLIRELAEFERISHEVITTKEILRESLFGAKPAAEAVIAEMDGKTAGFAVYFNNFSTFVGRPGLYIEDLYVKHELRGTGIGKALLKHCARVAIERNLGRVEWAVLSWNPAQDFYQHFGAEPMNDWVIYRLVGDNLKKLAER